MRNIAKIALVFGVFILSCKPELENNKSSIQKYWESLDSSSFSVYLGGAVAEQNKFTHYITADIETDAVASAPKVDAADDPAIWVNTQNPANSLVLGTNKKGGIHVYNMEGKELQYLPVGCMNNIDLRDGFKYNNQEVVLVAATNCTLNTISLFYIDKNTLKLSDTILNIKTTVDLVYGLCMYKSPVTNSFYIFVNGEGADVEQWKITSGNKVIKASLARSFKVSSRPEGMVADDIEKVLYIGVEEEGILKVNAEPESVFENIWVTGSNPPENNISSDIEGLGIYKTAEKTYLIASSQGNFSYALFEIGNPDKFITSFIIKDAQMDGVEETDGLDIVNFPLSDKFPKGMMVFHDGFNFRNDTIQAQNFKYISWEKIEKLINGL